MNVSNLKLVDRVTCNKYGAMHEVIAEGMVNDSNDARCRVCSDILVRWPQHIGLRLIAGNS